MRSKIEFGDFQTPRPLSDRICMMLWAAGIRPSTLIEPTCGTGTFLVSALNAFSTISALRAYDINGDYIAAARELVGNRRIASMEIERRDFFGVDWRMVVSNIPEPILVIGNLPWVTSARLGALQSGNMPVKSNFQGRDGFAAKTGKANFDISEWMLIRLLEALDGKNAVLAMLCKTATARKVLRHCWTNLMDSISATIHRVDAKLHFEASVDACLFSIHTGCATASKSLIAPVFDSIDAAKPESTLGLDHGEIISDIEKYRATAHIEGQEHYKWRSGVKHDAAPVMEFTREGLLFVNGLHERVDIEPDVLFPLLKSSDLANGRIMPRRYVLLTQHSVGEDTQQLRHTAPKCWRYLEAHSEFLDKRKSIIYARRPRFAIFGIGAYTFAPWKVAVSALYKSLRFVVIGHLQGKPIVVDDTCNFIPCISAAEARFAAELLNSSVAQDYLSSLSFPDNKRPLTIDVLKRIDLYRLAAAVDRRTEATTLLSAEGYDGTQQTLDFCTPAENVDALSRIK